LRICTQKQGAKVYCSSSYLCIFGGNGNTHNFALQNINKKCYAKLHPDCDYNFPDYFEMQDSEEFLYFAGNQ
jgi:hypothetical protein